MSIVATARMLRSARNEIFFVVEGDDDILLFSNSLGLPQSNFISCSGKERLMEVFQLAPVSGLDSGTIFFRDIDCDAVEHSERGDTILLTSDLYDFEMSLLRPRIFKRMFGEFARKKSTEIICDDAFQKIVEVASLIGALRHVSHAEGLNIKFAEYDTRFLDVSCFSIDLKKMIKYFMDRTKISSDISEIENLILSRRNEAQDLEEVTSGKDFLKIMGIALARFYKYCNSKDASFETLSRMFRIAVTHEDIKKLSLYSKLTRQVDISKFEWKGAPL